MKRIILGVGVFFLIFVFPYLHRGMTASTTNSFEGGGFDWGCKHSEDNSSEVDEVNLDGDGDGILDANDNCPNLYNPHQTDTLGEIGVGDACEVLGANTCEEALQCESSEQCNGHRAAILQLCGEGSVADGPILCCDNSCSSSDGGGINCPDNTCPNPGGHCSGDTDCPGDAPFCLEGCCMPQQNVSTCGNQVWDEALGEECDYVPQGPGVVAVGCEDGDCDPISCQCRGGSADVCGDGSITGSETCDFTRDGPFGCQLDQACDTNTCQCAGGSADVCGDGSITGSETCDFTVGRNGPVYDLSRCQPDQTCDTNTCQCTGGSSDTCGDGSITGSETCDFTVGRNGPIYDLSRCQPDQTCDTNSCQCTGGSSGSCDDRACDLASEDVVSCSADCPTVFCGPNLSCVQGRCGGPGTLKLCLDTAGSTTCPLIIPGPGGGDPLAVSCVVNGQANSDVCTTINDTFGLSTACNSTCCAPLP